jgi:sulfur relay (sulfurtransferase) DsrF/TusC family protein
MVKSLVIISDHSPIGRNSVIEAIRFASGLGAIEDTVKRNLILKGDAIFALKSDFQPEIMGMPSFDEVKMMGEMSDLIIYVSKKDLEDYSLDIRDLVDYKHLKASSEEGIANLILEADASFKF